MSVCAAAFPSGMIPAVLPGTRRDPLYLTLEKSISVFWGWVKFLSRLFIRVEYFDHQNGFDSL